MRHKARKVPVMRERGGEGGTEHLPSPRGRGCGTAPNPLPGVQLRRLRSCICLSAKKGQGKRKDGQRGEKNKSIAIFHL